MHIFIIQRAELDSSPLLPWETQEESCIIHSKGNLNWDSGKTFKT